MSTHSRTRSRSVKSAGPLALTEEDINQLIHSRRHYKAEAERWKKLYDYAHSLAVFLGIALIFVVVTQSRNSYHLLSGHQKTTTAAAAAGKPPSSYSEKQQGGGIAPPAPTLSFNPPWHLYRGYKQGYGSHEQWIAAKRLEMYFEAPGIYADKKTNLTLAHFGWMLQSPYQALNFDSLYSHQLAVHSGGGSGSSSQRGHVPGERAVRDKLNAYFERYLVAPWLPSSPFCSATSPSLFDPEICKYAVKRFEKQYNVLLGHPDGALRDWEDMVRFNTTNKTRIELERRLREKLKASKDH